MDKLSKRRIAVVGLGDIAEKAYLPIVATHLHITPVLCTRNEETLTRIANKYRIAETYTSLESLIATRPDAAMVHTATDSHYEIIKKLLTAGIPVFVDKPLSYTLKQCDELLDLSLATKTLLYVGFNRRFAPFIQNLSKENHPTQITWQKNRANLPGDPRVFVFDDFIHVIDSLLFLGKGPIEHLHIRSLIKDRKLCAVQAQWQQGDTFMQGSMNRVSGYTQELVDYYTQGNTWHINDFTTCSHFTNEQHTLINAGSWESALRKKGFYPMIEDWLEALAEKEFNKNRVESIRATHHFCEQIVNEISRK
ncbi:MAG: Gfo/Idh/MocA family oxidoreductase [Cytophagaceae bacterium]|nr:Gfo/Idh/MocA family oxidoreductase [Cytophagaceae bacterium]